MEEDETRHERGADHTGSGRLPRDFKLGNDMMIFIYDETHGDMEVDMERTRNRDKEEF